MLNDGTFINPSLNPKVDPVVKVSVALEVPGNPRTSVSYTSVQETVWTEDVGSIASGSSNQHGNASTVENVRRVD